jgi:hypothetical protein
MTALLHKTARPLDSVHAFAQNRLQLERTDIVFANTAPDRVGVEITLRNLDERPTAATLAVVHAAPLGAFLPWRPVGIIPIPAVAPQGSFILRLDAPIRRTAALGDPARLPPVRLLTALAQDDDRGDAVNLLDTGQDGRRPSAGAPLPADLFALLGRANPHWAGNLNVFIGDRAVERHLAQALRIYPGRTNLALFMVGSGRDEYSFALSGSGADWQAELYGLGETGSLFQTGAHGRVPLGQWLPIASTKMLMLSMQPPGGCRQGEVQVHVSQRSTGKTAVVEFSLDEKAAGPGCFVV